MNVQQSRGGRAGWTTRDLIVSAAISVALGLLFLAYGVVYLVLVPLLGQVGIILLVGLYYLPGILVPYIVRRPGAALLASVITAVTELLAGSPFGIAAVWAGLIQGLGAEAIFAVRRWRDYRLPVLLAAALMSGVFAYGYEYLLLGYSALAPSVRLGLFLLRLPSAAILAGWLGKALGDALARTGVLRGFAVTRER